MESQRDINAVNDACEYHQYDRSPEVIRRGTFTDFAIAKGGLLLDAHRAWEKAHPDSVMSYSVAAKYVNHFKKTQTYYVPEQRGPKSLLTDAETAQLLHLTALTRRDRDDDDARP